MMTLGESLFSLLIFSFAPVYSFFKGFTCDSKSPYFEKYASTFLKRSLVAYFFHNCLLAEHSVGNVNEFMSDYCWQLLFAIFVANLIVLKNLEIQNEIFFYSVCSSIYMAGCIKSNGLYSIGHFLGEEAVIFFAGIFLKKMM